MFRTLRSEQGGFLIFNSTFEGLPEPVLPTLVGIFWLLGTGKNIWPLEKTTTMFSFCSLLSNEVSLWKHYQR
jgi:hypothetical protein